MVKPNKLEKAMLDAAITAQNLHIKMIVVTFVWTKAGAA